MLGKILNHAKLDWYNVLLCMHFFVSAMLILLQRAQNSLKNFKFQLSNLKLLTADIFYSTKSIFKILWQLTNTATCPHMRTIFRNMLHASEICIIHPTFQLKVIDQFFSFIPPNFPWMSFLMFIVFSLCGIDENWKWGGTVSPPAVFPAIVVMIMELFWQPLQPQANSYDIVDSCPALWSLSSSSKRQVSSTTRILMSWFLVMFTLLLSICFANPMSTNIFLNIQTTTSKFGMFSN